jgi:hypothetical protein
MSTTLPAIASSADLGVRRVFFTVRRVPVEQTLKVSVC